jgi:predicted dehydrogenase
MMKTSRTSRRSVIKAGAAAAFAFQFVPQHVWGANERLQVGCIGIGGKGTGDVADVAAAGGQIVALCDVDDNRRVRKGKDPRELHPKASFHRDFRVMLDKHERQIDAVTVSTPDHVHCHAAVMAMRMGKHVYCQKPLTYSIAEARLMAETAEKHGVATQMGNQAHAGEPIRRAVEWIRAGLIGKVQQVHTWTNRPIWPQGLTAQPPVQPIPTGLDWDLWLGPAAKRPYNEAYCPFSWRGWWDFGTGALGDMGCHIMDMPFWALDLKYPTRVEAESEGNTPISAPTASTVRYQFPAGKYSGDLEFSWYDGGRMPTADVLSESGMTSKEVAGKFDLVMVGEKGKMFFNRSNLNWLITPVSVLEDFKAPEPSIPRVANEDAEWIEACKGGSPALSRFENAGPFTETVLLGNLAIRLDEPVEWDGPAMKAVGCPRADRYIHRSYRRGWKLG